MRKKCIICEKEAEYEVKGSNSHYCKECAKDYFGDISYLIRIEEEAQRLKKVIKDKLEL